jgi:hypothetical protein
MQAPGLGDPARLVSEVSRSAPLLPSCALYSFQGQPILNRYSKSEVRALCKHLHNDNEPTDFIIGRRTNGTKSYLAAKRFRIDRGIDWTISSISGAHSGREKCSVVFYSSNKSGMSRWGALDFDAHDDNHDRARCLAFDAFRHCLDLPYATILEFSGAGWHVWLINRDFRSIGDWVVTLRRITDLIGVTPSPGVCELRPPSAVVSGLSLGLRAPGSWNPSTDTNSEIYWDNLREALPFDSLRMGNRSPEASPREKEVFLSSADKRENELYSQWSKRWSVTFAITEPSTRNEKLGKLVGHVFHQVGRSMARQMAIEQFKGATAAMKATEAEHLQSFDNFWKGLSTEFHQRLSPNEQEIYCRFSTENVADAFRIVRSWSKHAENKNELDFAISSEDLAMRIGLTLQGAVYLRDRLVEVGAVERTKPHVPNRAAARYRWLAS